VAAITTFPAIAFVFANAALNPDASILTAPARTLPITAFLALPASLASWFAGKVLFVGTQLMLEM
jgi:hypothetical protein